MQGIVSQVNVSTPSGPYGCINGGGASGAGLMFYPDCVRGDVPFEELKGKEVYFEEGFDPERGGRFARYVKPI